MLDVQGHRGCRGLLPENTIPAFLKAVELGVNTLELDVVMSADGQVVVSHEAFLNPEICLGPKGEKLKSDTEFNLYKMQYNVIAKCDCGSLGNKRFPEQEKIWVKKPLLKEVIDTVKSYCEKHILPLPNFNVEIKSHEKEQNISHPPIPEFVAAVIKVLEDNLPPEKYNLQSFDVATLQYVHQHYPKVKVAFLVEGEMNLTDGEIEVQLKKLGFTPAIYSCYFKMLNSATVEFLHQKNMLVIPWTVNETDTMIAMMAMNVDGIITDYPNRLLKLHVKTDR